MEKNMLDWIALVLVIIGGLNWGIYGIWGKDLVNVIFGASTISTVVYILVGLSALYLIYFVSKE